MGKYEKEGQDQRKQFVRTLVEQVSTTMDSGKHPGCYLRRFDSTPNLGTVVKRQ